MIIPKKQFKKPAIGNEKSIVNCFWGKIRSFIHRFNVTADFNDDTNSSHAHHSDDLCYIFQ